VKGVTIGGMMPVRSDFMGKDPVDAGCDALMFD
jgi:hypothetical protein